MQSTEMTVPMPIPINALPLKRPMRKEAATFTMSKQLLQMPTSLPERIERAFTMPSAGFGISSMLSTIAAPVPVRTMARTSRSRSETRLWPLW